MVTLNDIHNFHLRPWLKSNNIKEKFDTKVDLSTNQYTNIKLNYKIKFLRPYNEKTRFYHTLILNTINAEFFQILESLPPESIENEILYVLNETLHKKLKTQLIQIGTLIKVKNFHLIYTKPQKNNPVISKEHSANSYVVQFLKLAYIQLYLEVQKKYILWVKEKKSIEDLYTEYLNEEVPKKILIIPALSAEEPTAQNTNQYQANSNHSFYYTQINTNPEKLSDLYNTLKQNHLIHPDTSLINFKRIFANTKINDPVFWTGTYSELYYFIKLIHNDLKLITDLKQKQWQIATICFTEEHGEPLDIIKLRKQRPPNETSKKIIEYAVSKLK